MKIVMAAYLSREASSPRDSSGAAEIRKARGGIMILTIQKVTGIRDVRGMCTLSEVVEAIQKGSGIIENYVLCCTQQFTKQLIVPQP